MARLTDQFNAPLVRLHPCVFDRLVDRFVLVVSEPVHCFDLWGVVRGSLGDTARCEKGSIFSRVPQKTVLSRNSLPIVKTQAKCEFFAWLHEHKEGLIRRF